MAASGEILYTFRTKFPDILQINRDNTVKMEMRRDGVIVPPEDVEKFELLAPDERVVFSNTGGGLVDGVPTVVIPASVLDPDASTDPIDLAELYQERWTIRPPGETTFRIVRREAAVARFVLAPPTAQTDLTEGEYPDLVDQLGSQGTTLQPYLDKAWGTIIRRMFRSGRWPDLLVSQEDLIEVLEARTYYLVFKYLFQKTGGNGNRWETLMAQHLADYEREWTALSGRWDQDHDGRADSLERRPASTVIHQNAAPRRRLRNTRRW